MNYRVLLGRLGVAVACAVAAVVAPAGGCGSSSKAKPQAVVATDVPTGAGGAAAAAAAAARPAQVLGADFGNAADAGGDASRASRLRVVQLEIYQLVVPYGAISRSEEFWKHIDEEQVDVGTYDLLRKNGWRVGTAPSGEWAYFRDIIDAYPASSRPYGINAGVNGAAGHMELHMKRGVPYQNVFYFTDDNALHGLTFERCDNLLNVSLQQVPRKPGHARVTVCPTVRSQRKRFEVNVRNEEREIRYVHPERLYDLNLQADIPTDHFLVIAPSPEVRWKTSLGATFLVDDGAAEQFEHVLLLVPRVALLEENKPAGAGTGTGQQ